MRRALASSRLAILSVRMPFLSEASTDSESAIAGSSIFPLELSMTSFAFSPDTVFYLGCLTIAFDG